MAIMLLQYLTFLQGSHTFSKPICHTLSIPNGKTSIPPLIIIFPNFYSCNAMQNHQQNCHVISQFNTFSILSITALGPCSLKHKKSYAKHRHTIFLWLKTRMLQNNEPYQINVVHVINPLPDQLPATMTYITITFISDKT